MMAEADPEMSTTDADAICRSLFASLDQGVCIIELVHDSAGTCVDYRMVMVNAAFERHIGLEHVRGKLASELVTDEHADWRPLYARVARTGVAEHIEDYHSGTGRWYRAHVSRVGAAGSRRVAIVFDDVTVRRRAEKALRASDERQAFLLEVADALRLLADPQAICVQAARLTAERLAADRAFYAEAGDDGEMFVVFDYTLAQGDSMAGRYRLDDFGVAFRKVMEAAQTLVVPDVVDWPGLAAAERQACHALGARALLKIPLVKDGRLHAFFGLHQREPRAWREEEVALAAAVAERTSAALERARAEAARRESESRYRALVTAGSDAVYRMSADWNRMHELEGRGFLVDTNVPDANWMDKYIHPQDRRRMARIIRETVRAKRGFELEHRVLRADGSEGWAMSRAVPLFDASGAIVEWFGTARDMTARKRHEGGQAFLLELFAELRPESDETGIGRVATRMLAGHLSAERCCIVKMSPAKKRVCLGAEYHLAGLSSVFGDAAVRELSGFPDCLCRSRNSLVAVADVPADGTLSRADRKRLASMRVGAFIAVPVRAGKGGNVWTLVVGSTHARAWSREETDLLETVAERTWTAIQRVNAEARLRHSEARLQKADRAKDEFLAMLGHELRNPLQPIATTLELMRLRDPDMFAHERAVIQAQLEYVTGMVDDLLDVSRIARGKLELKQESVAVDELVGSAIATAQSMLEEREQHLTQSVDGNLTVYGDRRRLIQIITNLLTNAAKYSPVGETIAVVVARDGNEAVLRVRDHGVGLAPELLKHVFDAFTQDPQSIARSQGGLGLGLAIVHNLVRMHGGRAEAHSEGRGHGSEFVVRLPLLEPDDARQTPAPEPVAKRVDTSECLKVLIVDDYARAADSLAELLRAQHCDTRTANDGAAALEMAAAFRPAVALVDIGLPVMDGYELARRLRAMPEMAGIKLIAVTGYGQESDRQRTHEAGFDRHVVKPIDAARMGGLVREVAASTR